MDERKRKMAIDDLMDGCFGDDGLFGNDGQIFIMNGK